MTALRVPSAGQPAGTAVTDCLGVAWRVEVANLESVTWHQMILTMVYIMAGPCLCRKAETTTLYVVQNLGRSTST